MPGVWFFFFQAEDGIRDSSVTGVQTCALPISRPRNDEGRCQNLLRIGLAQPVVVLAIHKHGRDTEEVQATRRWLREAPSRYWVRQPETCTFSSSIGRRLPIPLMIFLKHS